MEKRQRDIKPIKSIVKRLTLKQTNKLNGIVMMTRTHDKTINAFPHDSDSAFCSSSATRKGKAQKLNYIFHTHIHTT